MKLTHIGIDGNEANIRKRVGSNVYAFKLIKAINQISPINTTVFLKSKPLRDLPWESNRWQYRVIGPKKAWTQIRLPLELLVSRNKPEVFFSPGHYAPRFSTIPTAITILDLSFLKFPNQFLKHVRGVAQLKKWTNYSVKNASHIFTISQHTKKDIEEFYHINPKKITVAYPGVDYEYFHNHESKNISQKYNLPKKFILHLGTIQPRKNLIRLIQAFELMPKKFQDTHLVLAGQIGWLADDVLKAIKTSPKRAQILQPGFIDDQDIPALYAKASLTAVVGLYEGFGFPAAESIAAGTIPVVSNTASLPEVVGNAGILVDPYSAKSISNGLVKAMSTNKSQRLKALDAHIKKFSWEKTAKIVMSKLSELT